MSGIRAARRAMSEAAERAMGHADAAHWGSMDSTCPRCVALAGECGIDITRREDQS